MGIKKESNKYYVFRATPSESLRIYAILKKLKSGKYKRYKNGELEKDNTEHIREFENKVPKNPMDVPKISCETLLDRSIAKSVIKVWQGMLFNTRYTKIHHIRNPDGSIKYFVLPPLDGTQYHFGSRVGSGFIVGKVRSPTENSATGLLVNIASLLEEICLTSTNDALPELKKVVSDLEKKL